MRETRAIVSGHRWSRAEAEGLVRDFEQSGLKRKAFCEARGVALHTLDYYRYLERRRRVATPAAELLPVELIGATPTDGSLRVELASEATARGAVECPANFVQLAIRQTGRLKGPARFEPT